MPHSSNDQPAARFARYHTDSDERVLRVRYPKKRFGGISSRAIGMPNIIATTGNTNVANASFTSMARLYALGWSHVSEFRDTGVRTPPAAAPGPLLLTKNASRFPRHLRLTSRRTRPMPV